MGTFITIDTEYADLKQVASAYLIEEEGHGIVVETNTTHAIPKILSVMENQNVSPSNLDYIIVTHVHLDHAGGAWALLESCPNAVLLAHPKTAKHLIDPSLLIKSATAVYGKENFQKLYGEIKPIPKERVRVMEDGEFLDWNGHSFEFIYTKGHANHHFCIYDKKLNGVFTGDSFGISYPHLENGKSFIFPTTTPTDFDAKEAIHSIDLILGTGASVCYLTHFGVIQNLKQCAEDLKIGLHLCQNAILELKQVPKENRLSFMGKQVELMIKNLANRNAVILTEKDWSLLRLDVNLNAQGLVYAFERNEKK
ncbi:MBL fold metallo-hydrolase [Leptospira levettii]|uniref:MBL fold metallo-hydrolase n=1 Tax=Leptospira levettii TaxID=2023178 RepID=A0A6H3NDF6_9LEPT|nr:MBL fold metallo-hydrolase [Leptospira levettii]MCW7464734.1 MBL fold metallo-hydrolase [Leptospira levettii]MCW7508033.1 MBL fold metallo-hydrolase [Leptospira levettii]MCW7511082.1 MBL fold metallo-hydrolase [Leptospira levettii]MCW7514836.1 MBL fold metallo-hydrolase [Leptospira levettii]MCW7519123.1 MBL fold metallo-hydrolase [Leptospira levettii]